MPCIFRTTGGIPSHPDAVNIFWQGLFAKSFEGRRGSSCFIWRYQWGWEGI